MRDDGRVRSAVRAGLRVLVMCGFGLFICAGACNMMGPWTSGDTQRILTDGARQRSYYLHLPPAIVDQDRLPLVVLLHGLGTEGRMVARATGMQALANRNGFILACPDAAGAPRRWQFQRMVPAQGIADDYTYLSRLIASLCAEFPVDPARIYLMGYSNGANMAGHYALSAPSHIAAVAMVNGSLPRTLPARVSPAPRPIPILLVQGDADKGIPYHRSAENTSGRLCARDHAAFWVQYNKCAAAPTVSPEEKGGVTVEDYKGTHPAARVSLVTVHDGTHGWPGASIAELKQRPQLRAITRRLLWTFASTQTRAEAQP